VLLKWAREKSIKSAGVLKWVFENIRKRSKTFKNIQKLNGNIQKLTRNIQKYSNFLQGGAHLIDFRGEAKINQKYEALNLFVTRRR